MPQLTEISDQKVVVSGKKVILFGPPFSGKTLLAGSLAKVFKVLYIDAEGGVATLTKLPQASQENIFVQRIIDLKESPNMIRTGLIMASGVATKVCDRHGVVMNSRTYPKCKSCALDSDAPINDWKLSDLDPREWIVIWDSFTQLSSSANAHVTAKLTGDEDFEEFKHWRAQGKLMEKFLDYIQNAGFNNVVISHEEGIEQPDGSEKLVPSGGTKNFARRIAKTFDACLYLSIRNGKHSIMSLTTASGRILTGVRGGMEINGVDDLCKYFGKEVPENLREKSATSTKSKSSLSKLGKK